MVLNGVAKAGLTEKVRSEQRVERGASTKWPCGLRGLVWGRKNGSQSRGLGSDACLGAEEQEQGSGEQRAE